jgi:hypothetical protein
MNKQIKIGDYVSLIGEPDLIGKVIGIGTEYGSLTIEFPNSVIPRAMFPSSLELRSVLDLLAKLDRRAGI